MEEILIKLRTLSEEEKAALLDTLIMEMGERPSIDNIDNFQME